MQKLRSQVAAAQKRADQAEAQVKAAQAAANAKLVDIRIQLDAERQAKDAAMVQLKEAEGQCRTLHGVIDSVRTDICDQASLEINP